MIDLFTMFSNLSQSLYSVQRLVTGFGYIVGISLVIVAILKFKKEAENGSSIHMFVPMLYLLSGACLIFLPTIESIIANSIFGVNSVLAYAPLATSDNIYSAIKLLVQTTGVIWFVRGCVMLTHASEPGVQQKNLGIGFMFGGIFAINFDGTRAFVYAAFNYLTHLPWMTQSHTFPSV